VFLLGLVGCHLRGMIDKRVLVCPNCGQAYPWNGHCPPLGQLEDWTDHVRYSPAIGLSIGKIDYERDEVFGLLVPQLRTCVCCDVVFRIIVRTALNSEEHEAKTPAGGANLVQYLDYLARFPEGSDHTRILLQAWARSNDGLRGGETEQLGNPVRLEILNRVISRFQTESGANRLRAAEAARQSGKFEQAIALLNHQFDPGLKPYADFVRDLALLSDVLVRKVAVYPDIVAFEKAKARAAEDAAELGRAQARWKKQKETMSAGPIGVGSWGCLLLVGGIIGAFLLGQLGVLAILAGVILLLVYFPLYWIASRKADAWAKANPEPKWPIFAPAFKADPPIVRSIPPPPNIHREPERRTQPEPTPARDTPERELTLPPERSEVVDTIMSEWRDPALLEFAKKAKSLIEQHLSMLDAFLLPSEKAQIFRQSFVKHQIIAYAFLFTYESQQRYPQVLIGYQNQLISEIKTTMPLLSYSAREIIEAFHQFEARLAELMKETPDGLKFFVDSEREKLGDVPSIPGFFSFLVCEEAQVKDETVFTIFTGLFNCLIEHSQKEHPFDRLVDDFIQRISVRN
jgi:hypothetical protein